MNSKIISFAIEAHNKTNHLYDGKPYSVHLAMVAMYAIKHFDNAYIPTNCYDDIINACWLHDTIEDCRLTYNDVLKVAGEDVASIVYAVTNEKGKNRKERASDLYYLGIRETAWATYVKMCDRLANVKYSSDTKSRMLDVYRKENVDFLNSMFPNGKFNYLQEMVKELQELLGVTQPDA